MGVTAMGVARELAVVGVGSESWSLSRRLGMSSGIGRGAVRAGAMGGREGRGGEVMREERSVCAGLPLRLRWVSVGAGCTSWSFVEKRTEDEGP